MAAVYPGDILTLTSDGTNLTIPLTSIPGLTSSEANPTTGNAPEFILRLLTQMTTAYNALAAADKTASLVMVAGSPSPVAGIPGEVNQSFTVTVRRTVGDATNA